jgi:hypothetical protein
MDGKFNENSLGGRFNINWPLIDHGRATTGRQFPITGTKQEHPTMICSNLSQLQQLSVAHSGWISPVQVIRVACAHCQQSEVCPAVSLSEYEARKDQTVSNLGEIKKDVKE